MQFLDDLFKVDSQQPVNLQENIETVPIYLQRIEVRKEIARIFQDFLIYFHNESDSPIYIDRINSMVSKKCSLEVSYLDISSHSPIIALWLVDFSNLILEIFDETEYVLFTNQSFFHNIIQFLLKFMFESLVYQ
jgi:hypothetical protein